MMGCVPVSKRKSFQPPLVIGELINLSKARSRQPLGREALNIRCRLLDHAVGEAYAHVQGESLKAYAALHARLINSPITRSEEQMKIIVLAVISSLIAASAFAQGGVVSGFQQGQAQQLELQRLQLCNQALELALKGGPPLPLCAPNRRTLARFKHHHRHYLFNSLPLRAA